MTTSSDADTAVRNYLLFLEDPAQLVDTAEIERLQAEIDAATDPLDRLRALSKLQRARQSDEGELRAAFCASAKRWAEVNEVTVASLQSVGVTDDVLQQAGFAVPAPATRRPGKNRANARPNSSSPPVTTATIKSEVAVRTTRFTLADIGAEIGGSPMTVRKAVTEMISEGLVQRLGPTPNWSHQGRAPIVYQAITQHDTSRS